MWFEARTKVLAFFFVHLGSAVVLDIEIASLQIIAIA